MGCVGWTSQSTGSGGWTLGTCMRRSVKGGFPHHQRPVSKVLETCLIQTRQYSIPFSHRRRCRLPSLPFRTASLRFILSRADGGLRGATTVTWTSSVAVVIVTCCRLAERLEGVGSASRGIDRGLPVPRAMGETLSD